MINGLTRVMAHALRQQSKVTIYLHFSHLHHGNVFEETLTISSLKKV